MATLIDLPGRQGAIADAYVEAAIKMGQRALAVLSRPAVARFLSRGGFGGVGQVRFFNDDEMAKLVQVCSAILGTADLLGRARIRQQWLATLAAHGEFAGVTEEQTAALNELFDSWFYEDEGTAGAVEPMLPERALQYFRELVPELGVDPQRWGFDLRRRVFTLAAATDQELLKRVQDIIADRMQSGEVSDAPAMIQDVLDEAGVSPANPQYGEMVFRTNTMDALNQGATEALQDPDVIEVFPVWAYSNPDDERSRETHANRDGKYYPSDVPFVAVRGVGIEDAANCRCSFWAVSKWKWDALKTAGARIADGYADVLSMSERGAVFAAPRIAAISA